MKATPKALSIPFSQTTCYNFNIITRIYLVFKFKIIKIPVIKIGANKHFS